MRTQFTPQILKAYLQRYLGGESFESMLIDWLAMGAHIETLRSLLRGTYSTVMAMQLYTDMGYTDPGTCFMPAWQNAKPNAKLSLDKLKQIRQESSATDIDTLAEKYTLKRATVLEIVKGTYASANMQKLLQAGRATGLEA